MTHLELAFCTHGTAHWNTSTVNLVNFGCNMDTENATIFFGEGENRSAAGAAGVELQKKKDNGILPTR